jgi:hypothetical protein
MLGVCGTEITNTFTMAALEAAQPANVSERNNSSAIADAVSLGGRVKPGHGELF